MALPEGFYGPPRPINTAAPETEEDFLAALLELDKQAPQAPMPEFSGGASPGFLERLGTSFAGGVPQGQGFGGSFLSGLVGGLANQGQKVAAQRAQFEATMEQRRRERDQANLEATREKRRALLAGLNENRAETRRLQREAADRANLESDAYARARGTARANAEFPNPRADNEPLVLIQTDDGPRYVKRSDAEGKAPPSATDKLKPPAQGEREQLTADIGMLQGINAVRNQFKKEFTGPVAGKLGGFQQATGLGLGKGESGFRAQVAGLRNQIGKLRSGQAISESEAARLLQELPTVDDPSEVFLAKLDNFENTYREIANTRREVMSGTGVDLSRMPALPPRAMAGGTVKLKAPTGEVMDVAADKAEHYLSRGATRVN